MGYSTFYHTKITGISFIVPKDEISIDDEIEYYENSHKKVQRIKKMIGIDKRRVAPYGITAADLCQQAVENMLAGMDIDKDSIDALIFISQSPDYAIPATACILQHKLGLSHNCATFDVNQGCTAYTYGLWLASSLIDSKACKRVLVLVGEAGAKYNAPENRILTPIFGDSACASLLEYTEEKTPSYYALGSDGSGAEALMVPVGHARCPWIPKEEDSEFFLDVIKPIYDENNNPWYLGSCYMNGGEIFNFTMSVVPSHLENLLDYAKCTQHDIDYFVIHQANKQIAESIARKVNFPLEKVPVETVSKYGNQAGASLAGVICDQLSEIVQTRKTKLLLSGFGVGLSWASTVLEVDTIYCSGIQEYKEPEHIQTREEFINYWRNKIATKKNEY